MTGKIEVTAPNKPVTIRYRTNLVRLKAKETRVLPRSLELAAKEQGCDVEVVVDEGYNGPDAGERITMIAKEMQKMIAEDNPDLKTSNGSLRVGVLEERLGFDTTKEDRAEAEAMINGG